MKQLTLARTQSEQCIRCVWCVALTHRHWIVQWYCALRDRMVSYDSTCDEFCKNDSSMIETETIDTTEVRE